MADSCPKISVVVPVYNCARFVRRAIESVADQTLDASSIEVIAVDDGSDDGSAQIVESLTKLPVRVIPIALPTNSGGEGRPRNIGISLARGKYIMFFDADDYLGGDSLRRLMDLAEGWGSDVVLPKCIGVNRGDPRKEYSTTIARTNIRDLYRGVLRSYAGPKFVRRDLLIENDIRYPEGIGTGADKLFDFTCFVYAKTITLAADYDYYYAVGREDGSSLTQLGRSDPGLYYPMIAHAMLELVVTRLEPGETRDRLLAWVFQRDVLQRFDQRYLDGDDGFKERTRVGAREAVAAWLTPEVLRLLPVEHKLLVFALTDRTSLLDPLAALRLRLRDMAGRSARQALLESSLGRTLEGVPIEYMTPADNEVRMYPAGADTERV